MAKLLSIHGGDRNGQEFARPAVRPDRFRFVPQSPHFCAIIDVSTSVRVMVGGGITASRLLGDLRGRTSGRSTDGKSPSQIP